MKILILSDFHFGIPASRVHSLLEDIRPLARQYDRVILNGDTLDRYETPGCTPNAESWYRDVTDACSSRCGPPDVVMGNHDPAISSTQWVYLPESATLVFHGDCVADCTQPSRADEQMLAARLRRHWSTIGGRPAGFVELSDAYRRIQAQHLREDPMSREPKETLKYLASLVIPPHKPLQILRYCWRAPRLAALLGKTFPQPVRYVITGHTHRAGRWQISGVTVLNTGSFMPLSVPYAACVDGATVSLRRLTALLRAPRACVLPLAQGGNATKPDGAHGAQA